MSAGVLADAVSVGGKSFTNREGLVRVCGRLAGGHSLITGGVLIAKLDGNKPLPVVGKLSEKAVATVAGAAEGWA